MRYAQGFELCVYIIQANGKSKGENIGMVYKGRRQDREGRMDVAILILLINRHKPYLLS